MFWGLRMVGTDPGSAREEAERLVATVLAGLRLAGVGMGSTGGGSAGPGPLGDMISAMFGHRGNLATGSAECSVCPICRTITALRDPRPEVAERLAAGAGDLAAGVASLLRAFATVTGPAADPSDPPTGPTAQTGPTAPTAPADEPVPGGGKLKSPADPTADTGPAAERAGRPARAGGGWRSTDRTRHDLWPAAQPDVWAEATRAGGSPGPAAAPGSGTAPGSATESRRPTARTVGSTAQPETAGGDVSTGRAGVVPVSRTPAEEPVTGDDAPGNEA